MPRDDEHLDDEVDPTSDTHVPEEDDEQGSSVFHDDDDAIEAHGIAVSDVTLRKADHSPLQDFVAAEWTPGEQETFSTTSEPDAMGEQEASPDVLQQGPVDGGDTDAPTVVIKGKRPDSPASNSEFDAATEPLPSPESERLNFTPHAKETADKSINFPREKRPDALPLPSFEPLAPPSLDPPPAKPVIEPAASAPSDSATETETSTDSDSASMPALRGPEMESGLPLPTLSDASTSPSSAAPQAQAVEAAGTAEATESRPARKSENGKSATTRGGMNLGIVLLFSYASAVTLILIMMLMRGNSAQPHHLESLPDVAPEPENKLSYVPVNATLAPGHTLKLGEKRRFGNIEVEALRVTHEPLQFKHYSGNPGKKKPESAPVLKLWLRFTNVSTDQTIAPLDRPLLLRWVAKAGGTTEFSNQYLFPGNKRSEPNAVVSTYRMPQTSDWDLVGQELDRELAPGESYETYIASSDDGTAEIQGPIVWRVQMRKGFSPQGHGVTTMIEVDFDRKEVQQG